MRITILSSLALMLVAAPGVHGQDEDLQKHINRAIKKGVVAIQAYPRNADGLLRYQGQDIGLNALVGWTLLESDVPASDEMLAKLTQALRGKALEQSYVYTISLLLIFFDRLGDPGDEPIIEYLALQLLASQTSTGGWTYGAPAVPGKEKQLAMDLVAKAHEQRKKGEIGPSKEKPSARKPRPVSQRMAQAVEDIEGRPRLGFVGDNSNTQFAMLALWVARRHGVPVDEALARVVQRFQKTQQANGGWGYLYDPSNLKGSAYPATCTMSCAGMLGLALGHGITRKKDDKKPADLKKDPHVKEGMRIMDEIMKESTNEKDIKRLFGPSGNVAKPGYFHFFLFSLERMAVVYNLKKIGDKDWYRWGAKLLVDTQHPTGAWYGAPDHGIADTCFALLFLKRANVAEDLTFNLMGINPIMEKKKKGSSKKPEPDPFELPKLIPKDKKKTKGAFRDDGDVQRGAGSVAGARIDPALTRRVSEGRRMRDGDAPSHTHRVGNSRGALRARNASTLRP